MDIKGYDLVLRHISDDNVINELIYLRSVGVANHIGACVFRALVELEVDLAGDDGRYISF